LHWRLPNGTVIRDGEGHLEHTRDAALHGLHGFDTRPASTDADTHGATGWAVTPVVRPSTLGWCTAPRPVT
jgi:hypothetical protein